MARVVLMLCSEAYWAHLLCATSSTHCVSNPLSSFPCHPIPCTQRLMQLSFPLRTFFKEQQSWLMRPWSCVRRRGRSWDQQQQRGLHSSSSSSSWGQLEEVESRSAAGLLGQRHFHQSLPARPSHTPHHFPSASVQHTRPWKESRDSDATLLIEQ